MRWREGARGRERERLAEGRESVLLEFERERDRGSKILNVSRQRREKRHAFSVSLVHFKINVPHRHMKMLATSTYMEKMWRFACTEAFL